MKGMNEMRKRAIIWLVLIFLSISFLSLDALAVTDINVYTPYDVTAKELPQDELHPYGSVLLTFTINGLPRSTDNEHWEVSVEKKLGNGDWIGVDGLPGNDCLDRYQASPGVFSFEQLYVETYDWDGVSQISYRLCVKKYDSTWSGVGQSGYSNTVSIGLTGSPWAMTELKQANELGLIPDSLSGADLTRPITREEFAEIAVLLYEKTTGKNAVPVSPNPFTDTTNPQVLKAYTIKITEGTTATTFEPNLIINREQCATMLFRTIKAIAPAADYTTAGVPDFPDQKDISPWAVEGTKYMSKLEIIRGDASGKFMPKAMTTAQEATGYGTATREAAIIFSARSYSALTK
jgi:hypothetical protein